MIQTLFGNPEPETKIGLMERMKQAVMRTRQNLNERIDQIVSSEKGLDQNSLDELEAALLTADLGMATTTEILDNIQDRSKHGRITDAAELKQAVKKELLSILQEKPELPPSRLAAPYVIMLVGVNGTGKTTTIGKLAYALKGQGKTVLMCAADTFRAAAIEQLEVWGNRTGTPVIKTKPGGDPAAVLYDGLQMAINQKIDCVIIDTAGRLHTKQNLMLELDKMRRTAKRLIPDSPHEILLVMDATTGQNGLQQARQFTQAAGVTGIILTKLDGTAKGGILVAICRELALPVRYVGVGEGLGDLLPFDAQTFVDSML